MDKRYVTVVFSDLCDSTPLSRREDPEIVGLIESQLREAGEGLAKKYGGVVNQFHGDGMLVLFGLPHSSELDTVHAVNFALDLHAHVNGAPAHRASGFKTKLHSGIDTGLVAIDPGTPASGVYGVYGECTNRAARLSDAAAPGEILVNVASLGRIDEFFVTSTRRTLQLKGIDKPLKVATVDGRSGVTDHFQASIVRGLTKFTGRKFELEQIYSASRLSEAGTFSTLSAVGDAGVGKTRLIEEFLKRRSAQGWTVLRGCAEQEGATAPFQPFLSMLPVVQSVNSAGSAIHDSLETYLISIDPALRRHGSVLQQGLTSKATHASRAGIHSSLADAMYEWSSALCRMRKVIWFVDDWQHVDDASRWLLSKLIDAQPGGGLFLTSTRSLEPGDPASHGEILRVDGLDDKSSRIAINRLIPHNVQPGIVRQIQERSGGNPLFIEELCQAVRIGPSADTLPATLSGLIGSKVPQLSEEARRVAFIAAVVGTTLPNWLMALFCDDFDVYLELTDFDILQPIAPATFKFKHGVTREVVYTLIPLQDKQALHVEVARILRNRHHELGYDEPIESLAYHFTQSDDYEQGAAYARMAGDKALATNTLDRARHHYRSALKALSRLPRTEATNTAWVANSNRLALACTYAPTQEVIRTLTEAHDRAAELGVESKLAEVDYYLGWLHYGLGNQQASMEHSRRALALAEQLGAEKLIAQLFANLGQSAAAACDYPRAHEYLNKAIGIKSTGTGKSPPIGWAYAVSCKALVVADEGNFEESDRLMSLALESIANSGQAIEASILNMYTVLRTWRGQWREAIQVSKRVQTLCELHSLPYLYAMSRSIESYSNWTLTGDPEALTTLRSATHQLESTEMQLYFSLNCGWMADVLSAVGQYAEAHDYAITALEYASVGDKAGNPMALRALHRMAALNAVGGLEAPEIYLTRAYEAAQERGSKHDYAVTLLHDAHYQVSLGALPAAQERATTALQAFQAMGMHWHRDATQQLLADINLPPM